MIIIYYISALHLKLAILRPYILNIEIIFDKIRLLEVLGFILSVLYPLVYIRPGRLI